MADQGSSDLGGEWVRDRGGSPESGLTDSESTKRLLVEGLQELREARG